MHRILELTQLSRPALVDLEQIGGRKWNLSGWLPCACACAYVVSSFHCHNCDISVSISQHKKNERVLSSSVGFFLCLCSCHRYFHKLMFVFTRILVLMSYWKPGFKVLFHSFVFKKERINASWLDIALCREHIFYFLQLAAKWENLKDIKLIMAKFTTSLRFESEKPPPYKLSYKWHYVVWQIIAFSVLYVL